MEFFSKNLKYLRLKINNTQKELSKELNLSLDMIKSLETNRANPSLTLMIKLRTFFNTSIDDLLFKDLEKENHETQTIDSKTMRQIIEYLNKLQDNLRNLRDKAIIFLFIDTGIRLNELIHIELKNFNSMQNSILLTYTKTNKNRTIFFTENTKNIILKYIVKANLKDGYIFRKTRTNQPITKSVIDKLTARIKKDLNIKISISTHKFRHTLASQLLQNGMDIRSVQLILGHSELNITQKYLHISNQNLKHNFDKYKPKY